MNNNSKTKSAFISYHEKNTKSLAIAKELVDFFKDWDVKCELIINRGGSGAPSRDIQKSIGKCTYFIWLFTDNYKPSEWMLKEWLWFENRHSEDIAKESKFRYIFFVEQKGKDILLTNIKRTRYSLVIGEITTLFDGKMVYRKIEKEAKIECVQISRERCEKILSSILVHNGLLKENHGPIILPTCSQGGKTNKDFPDYKEFIALVHSFGDATSGGLSKVYPDKELAMKGVEDAIHNLKENEVVKLLGFTLRRYIHEKNSYGKKNQLGLSLKTAIEDKKCKLRVLSLKKDCSAAKERMEIENPGKKKEETFLFKDRRAVVHYCVVNKWYHATNENSNVVSLKVYDNPYVGMVIFEEKIFVEIYHLGDDGIDQKKEKPICGKVPVLVIRKSTPFYSLFESHFDRAWKSAKWEKIP